jgi:hypothetical protein
VSLVRHKTDKSEPASVWVQSGFVVCVRGFVLKNAHTVSLCANKVKMPHLAAMDVAGRVHHMPHMTAIRSASRSCMLFVAELGLSCDRCRHCLAARHCLLAGVEQDQ